jgi:hypothetical protein
MSPRQQPDSAGEEGTVARKRRIRFTRDGVLFVAGLVGLAYETYTGGERVTLLLVFAAMMGLPAFIQADERKQRRSGEDDER